MHGYDFIECLYLLIQGLFVSLFYCNQVTDEVFLLYSAAVLRQDVAKCKRIVYIVSSKSVLTTTVL